MVSVFLVALLLRLAADAELSSSSLLMFPGFSGKFPGIFPGVFQCSGGFGICSLVYVFFCGGFFFNVLSDFVRG